MTTSTRSTLRSLPDSAVAICRRLHEAGYDAALVGGGVRDLVLGREPKDIDLATAATPDEIRRLFPRAWNVGRGERHGTLAVRAGGGTVDITTFRRDVETDGRHATVVFARTIEEDLARRDFTMNAMAIRPDPSGAGEIIDLWGGQEDLAAGRLRTVGVAAERFREDYLRILRLYRFAGRLNLEPEASVRAAVRSTASGLRAISAERVRDELLNLFEHTRTPGRLAAVLRWMNDDGIVDVLLPELARCRGVTQNRHHAYDVFDHIVEATDAAGFVDADIPAIEGERVPSVALRRLVMLCHDLGKPATRTDDGGIVRFLGHESVGADMARDICARLRLPGDQAAFAVTAVAQHMRLHMINRGVSERAVRRLMAELEHGVTIEELVRIRLADKRGSGVAASQVEESAVEQVMAHAAAVRAKSQPVRTADVALDGRAVMAHLGLGQGRAVGAILRALYEHVLDAPDDNTPERLTALLGEWAQSGALSGIVAAPPPPARAASR